MIETIFNRPTGHGTQFGRRDFAQVLYGPQREHNRHILEQEFITGRISLPISGDPIKAGLAKALSSIVTSGCVYLSANLRQQIAEISKLQKGWDGEAAEAVKPHVLADAVEILCRLKKALTAFHEPYLVPTFEGYVQLEWHGAKRSLEIEAVPGGWNATGTLVGSTGERNYFHSECGRSDFGEVEKLYGWFVGTELLWPSL